MDVFGTCIAGQVRRRGTQAVAAELLESDAVLGRHDAKGVHKEPFDLGAERLFWRVTAVLAAVKSSPPVRWQKDAASCHRGCTRSARARPWLRRLWRATRVGLHLWSIVDRVRFQEPHPASRVSPGRPETRAPQHVQAASTAP